MALEISKGSAQFLFGFSELSQLEKWLKENPQVIGLSFVGRSNVGKSSMINSLFGKKTARVSNTPGRTREINIFSFKLVDESGLRDDLPPFYLFDLPGYGFAEVSKDMQKKWDQLMSCFFSLVSPRTLMINIQDARHPNQKNDQEFHQFLKRYPFETHLIFNKIDKLKTQKERALLNKLKPELFKEYKWVKQIYFASAETRQGMPEVELAITTFITHKLLVIEHEKHGPAAD